MWKLTQLVEEKEKQEKAEAEKKDAGKPAGETEFQIKRTTSKELAEERKKKSKDNVFRIGGQKKAKNSRNQVQASELRVQADLAELDPEATPGVNVTFPDEKNILKFDVDVTPADGLYKGATFRFNVEVPLSSALLLPA